MRRFVLGLLSLLLVGCDYIETTREVGHKGKARLNPFLAAERLLEANGYENLRSAGWPDLEEPELALLMVPASVLTAEGYVNLLRNWVSTGGHVVIMMEWSEYHVGDWSDGDGPFNAFGAEEEVGDALSSWLEDAGLGLKPVDWEATQGSEPVEEIILDGETFEVFLEADSKVIDPFDEEELFASVTYGGGRISVISDSRPFRNRWIGNHDHADLLLTLGDLAPRGYGFAFVRNASLSFWRLLWQRAWPFVVALLGLVAFWLWKNLPRFGPIDSVEPEGVLRAYDQHLEALGDFHWRLDHGEGLLKPLRVSLLERGHHLALTSGQKDADIFQLMADRAGITRIQAERAMTFERARDAGSFTRLVADLQKLHLSIP